MSSEVFSEKETVFFVCGGHSQVGGCTLQYVFDNGGFSGFDKSKIMDGNGDPIISVSDATYRNATGIIEEGTPGDFDDAEAGMILNIYKAGGIDTPGRYEITAVGSGTVTIKTGLASGDVSDCFVYVGGSFDTLKNALDNITANDAGGAHSCYLFTNTSEVITAQPVVSGGGNIEYNTKLFITGFKTTLLDMMPGGTYYQSAYDAYKDGIDSDCHTVIDLGDINAFSVDSDCVIVQNIRITNCPTGSAPVYIAAAIRGVIFNNCILDTGSWIIYGESSSTNIYFIDCYMFGNTSTLTSIDSGNCDFYFIGCIADMGAVDLAMFAATSTDRLVVTGCLLIGGRRIFSGHGDFNEWNNTVIAHATNTDAVHRMNGATALRIGFGDIVVIPQAGNVVDIGSSGGCVLWQGFQCIWGSDDAEYTGDYSINAKSGGGVNRLDLSSFKADPDLDGNYRARNPQVLRGGPAMLSNGRSQLGAIKQKYQFPQKGRTVNHGRLGILR